MIYMTNGLTRRRRPTARTWTGFVAALTAALTMLALTVGVVYHTLPERAAAAEVGDAVPMLTGAGALGAGGAGAPTTGADSTREPTPASSPSPKKPAKPAKPSGQPSPEPTPTGPQIHYFQVAQQPLCPSGTTTHPIEGQPVTLEWKVTGVEQTTLSIDGPGVYDTYPAEGGDTIHFPCEGNDGDTQEHTYLLTATGEDETVTEQLVVTATIQEVTDLEHLTS